ncbi:nitroreductase/quinone reductase family protein [Mycetocola manganoxydans]|nr:nitroreductase/quinone reductase family protein [Mycetocola manganoxydans]GHD39206.1 hypothetical protein GCM10008097_01640 [Mycetocola manganoxydans]
MTLRTSLTDFGMRAMNGVHRILLAVSGGKIGRKFGRMIVVELHTIGRTSNKRRSTMLTAPIFGNGTYVLVASKGGDRRNPQWYTNLTVNPEVELTVDGTTSRFIARTATDDERQRMWPEIVTSYSGYAGYQRRTDRQIPVVICEPVGDDIRP